MNREGSLKAFARAKQLIPGGVNSPARAFGAVGGQPIFFESALGPWLTDIDGNRYIDYIGSWGPMILGHSHPRVVKAIQETAAKGTSFGAPTELESQMAELIMAMVPSMERVRMVNSGTEATMSALRLARGHTGRDKIIKFAGCYHGHVDSLLVQAGSSATTLGVPNSPGVPRGSTQDTVLLEFNDCQGLQDAFMNFPQKIAAVILEPIAGNMGLVLPGKEFLRLARELTSQHGSVLIFDEVMTGFRLAQGGAQEILGVTPDLTALGKIVGGGLPVGAYGGRKEIMEKVMPAGPVFQAGTLSGNPLAMAAGIATLSELRENPPYAKLEQLAQTLTQGLKELATAAGIPHSLNRVGSMWTLFFTPQPVTDYRTAKTCDTRQFSQFFWAMMDRGVYLPCSQFEAAFNSIAHDEGIVQKTLAAAEGAFAQMGK
ncbi:MAG: glutamate-1-semialdehyde-2,1-aminomutase [Gemmataceae bacterium]|nr:glutamate-1-semialdehyde-2,1-aminomutase [Gemmataceae bacterium]